MTPLLPDPILRNQSLVRFTSGSSPSVSYSNVVEIPLYGPAIDILKQSDGGQADLGTTLAYRLTVSNSGNAAAQVTVYDPVPAGTSLIVNSVLRDGVPLPGADPANGIPLGSIAPGTEALLTFQVIVTEIPATLALTNRARAAFTFLTPEGRESRGEAMSNEVRIPVKAVRVTASLRTRTTQTFAGDVVIYDIVIANDSTRAIGSVNVLAPLPPGTTFLQGSVTVNDVRSLQSSPVTGIAVGAIPAGGSAIVSYNVQVGNLPDGTLLTNEAIVSYSFDGDTTLLQTNAVSVVVIKPEVTLTLSSSPGGVAPGGNISYTLTALNASSIAVDATLYDFLPAGLLLDYGSIRVNGTRAVNVLPSGGIPLGLLPAGGSAIVTFQASVPAVANPVTTPAYRNQAQLTYSFRINDGRAVSSASTSNAVVTLLVCPVLVVEVTARPSPVSPGEIVQFQAEVRNEGNMGALTDLAGLLPDGSSFVEPNVSVNGIPTALIADGTVALGLLDPGERVLIAYRVRVAEDIYAGSLRGYLTAYYRYSLDDVSYHGQVRSNGYLVLIDDHDE